MAIFNKSNTDSGQTTIISSQTHIKGEFEVGCILHIDGSVEGRIISQSTVIIGKNGSANGSIKAKRVVVNGKFLGDIEAEFVELLNGGVLVGDVVSQNLGIEIGAKFSGKSSLPTQNEPAAIENKSDEIVVQSE